MTKTKTLYTPLAMLLMLVLLLATVCVALIYRAKAEIAQSWTLADRIVSECERVDVSEGSGHTDDYIALLFSAGYQGVPGDSMEAVYSPACNVERHEDGTVLVWGIDPNTPQFVYEAK